MKRVIGLVSVFAFFVVLSVYLYTSGKGHTVYFTNYEIEGIEPIKEIIVNIDDNKKNIKVKADKKVSVMAKGSTHTLFLTYKVDGEKVEKSINFKTKVGKEAIVALSDVVNGGKDYITYEDIVVEIPQGDDEAGVSADEVKLEI